MQKANEIDRTSYRPLGLAIHIHGVVASAHVRTQRRLCVSEFLQIPARLVQSSTTCGCGGWLARLIDPLCSSSGERRGSGDRDTDIGYMQMCVLEDGTSSGQADVQRGIEHL
jgi:hypothetical protein